MKETTGFFFMLCIGTVFSYTDSDEATVEEVNALDDSPEVDTMQLLSSDCWMTLNTPQLFKIMDEIDERYAKIRREVQDSVISNKFDQSMINGFIYSKGAAVRELYKHHYQPWMIPSGINLGGYSMLKMPNSVLFFHRMKLRNNTYFRIDNLQNNLADMVLHVFLTLNDLHLKGAYERSLTDTDPSVLIYAPTLGEVEFLLKDVRYRMEGRYRLIKNRLVIELISSELYTNDILMTYINQAIENQALKVEKKNLGAFISKLKTDLDKWLKDYFNDFMIYAGIDGLIHIDELEKYDKEKGTALEEYTDNAIDTIKNRLRKLNAHSIKIPVFTLKSINGLQIKLYDGILRGLDSMYRRSVATGVKQRGVRKVDTVVGFSDLKVVYKYEAMIPTGIPPLTGVMTLSANELTAHLALAMVNEPETIDLDIEFLDQLKPESLTVEGAANIMIANFKHLLEHQIVAIMSSTLFHGINMLRTLPRCEPFVPGQIPKQENKKIGQVYAASENTYDYNSENNEGLAAVDADSHNIDYGRESITRLGSTKRPQRSQHQQSNKSNVARKKLKKFPRKKLVTFNKTKSKKHENVK